MQRSILGFITDGSGLTKHLSLKRRGFKGVVGDSELKTREAREENNIPGDQPRFPGKCARNVLGCPMLESFLTVETGHQRASLVEGISREAWQEKGELNWMGIRQKIHVTKSESHLTLGLT